MSIDDRLDAAETRIADEKRLDSAPVTYARDFSDIISAIPTEWLPETLAGPIEMFKSAMKGLAYYQRKIEEDRRRYLTETIIEELRWVRDKVEALSEDQSRFVRDEFPPLVLDALQKAERTRSNDRIFRMARVLGSSVVSNPPISPDEVEELLRISMELDEIDVRVLAALVEGQRHLLPARTGMITPGDANRYWQRASSIGPDHSLSEITERVGVSEGAFHSSCAKLQAYGLLVQAERDESKLRRGVILYVILPRAVAFVDAANGVKVSAARHSM